MSRFFRPQPAWRRRLCLLFLPLLLALPAARAGASDDDSPKDAERNLREQGWTVDSINLEGAEQPGVRHLVATGRIAAPPEDVWLVISSPTAVRDKWPSLKESITESESGDTTIARFLMAVPIYPDRRYRLRSIADDAHKIYSFELIPGYGNVHEIKGAWKVASLGDSLSQVTYDLYTDPGVKLVPGFIINWATRKAIPRAYAFIDKEARLVARSSERMNAQSR